MSGWVGHVVGDPFSTRLPIRPLTPRPVDSDRGGCDSPPMAQLNEAARRLVESGHSRPGFITHISIHRVGGQGPWSD